MKKFTETKVGLFLGNIGLKPITDLLAGSTGLISAIKEGNGPDSKISSRRGAGMVLIGIAGAMSTTIDYAITGQWVSMLVFAVLGTSLLAITSFNSRK